MADRPPETGTQDGSHQTCDVTKDYTGLPQTKPRRSHHAWGCRKPVLRGCARMWESNKPHPAHGLPWWLSGHESACQCWRHGFNPREDLLKKEMATHTSIPAWDIPWTEEPGGLQFIGSRSQAQLSD